MTLEFVEDGVVVVVYGGVGRNREGSQTTRHAHGSAAHQRVRSASIVNDGIRPSQRVSCHHASRENSSGRREPLGSAR